MLPQAAGLGQHFKAQGHSFPPFVYATLSLNRFARRPLTIVQSFRNELVNSDTRQRKMYERTDIF